MGTDLVKPLNNVNGTSFGVLRKHRILLFELLSLPQLGVSITGGRRMATELSADTTDMVIDEPQQALYVLSDTSSFPDGPRASSVPLHQSEFTVGYVYSTEMTSHFSPHGHPEDPERISRIYHALTVGRHTKKMKWLPVRPARKEEVLLIHSEDHWDKVQAIQGNSVFYFQVHI